LLLFPLAAGADEDRGCIWKLEGPAATVYVAGSVHLLRAQDHPLPRGYAKAYEDAARVVFEIDLASTRTPEAQQRARELGALPDGETLDTWLSPETLAAFRNYVAERGLGAAGLDRLRPGMISMTISATEAMRLGAMPHLGVEWIFQERAREDGKPVQGLETMEFQLGLFTGMSREEQEKLLGMTLDQVREAPDALPVMIRAWRAGDGEALAREMNRHLEEADGFLAKRLLHDRNASWIPAIEEALRNPDGNTLFIVGAGHLVGEKSVIELLEAKGYRPTPWAG
jgi:uncharacterized protein YbaP (TraB family)